MNLALRTIKSFNRKEKLIAIVLAAILLASFYNIFLGGNGNGEKGQSKIYTEGIVGEIKHINPVFTEFSEADADISSLVFSGLAKYNPETKTFDEDITTHILDEDKLTYTFTLRNDVLWHDGTEVSADDIFFTFSEVIQSEEFNNPILKANFEGVKIEKVDSRTVSFTLNNPNSFFFTALTVGLLPHHILGDVPISELDTHDFNKHPIGTGPYQVVSPYEFLEDGATSVNLTINPLFYGELPSVENIRFIAYPNSQILADNRSVWKGAARIRQSLLNDIDTEDLVVNRYELPQYTALFFNTDAPNLTRNKTRLGISKAIDKAAILEAIEYNKQIDTPILELNQEDWIHTYDLEEARGALFDAGWNLEDGDRYRKNTEEQTLTLRLVRRDFKGANELQEKTLKTTAEMIRDQLEELGIEIIIEAYPLEQLQEKIVERDYDLLLYGQSLGYNLDIFSYWHSSQVSEEGLNLSNYQNPKADFYMESIRGSFDAEERQELLESLADIIAEDIPAVFLYTPSYYYLTDVKLTGVSTENLLLPRDRFATLATWNLN